MFLVSFLSFYVTRSFEIVSLMKFQGSCRDHSLFYNRGGSLGNLHIIKFFSETQIKVLHMEVPAFPEYVIYHISSTSKG